MKKRIEMMNDVEKFKKYKKKSSKHLLSKKNTFKNSTQEEKKKRISYLWGKLRAEVNR
jgi:hypothetical protein